MSVLERPFLGNVMSTNREFVRRAAILPGDPAGIGYEITAQALADPTTRLSLERADFVTVIYADADIFERCMAKFSPNLRVIRIDDVCDAVSKSWIYLLDCKGHITHFEPGVMSAACAKAAHEAICRAVEDAKLGLVHGICTGPIHKGAMRLAGIRDIGHTEMLANGFGVADPTTLFLTKELRIFFYTRHLSLKQAIDALDTQRLVDFAIRVDSQMHQLGFAKPHIALAALNPHASDGGQFGDEEDRILLPAARLAREHGVDLTDPIGADSVFAQAATGRYDAVISLYHDQGHIAAKTYDFDRTISATLGLPILRTSVDHGTAFDIAWTGKAQFLSMMTALQALERYA